MNNVLLHFDGVTPLDPPGPDSPLLDVTVLSAGNEVGDFGHIYANGHEISPNQRGYNIAVIQPGVGPVAGNFDTHLDPAASLELADFIARAKASGLGEGAVVAAAAADEASSALGEDAVEALQAVGASQDLRGCFRCGHALISMPNGEEIRVIEDLDSLRPVGVSTRLGLTEPNLAVVIDWIRVEPAN